MKYIALILLACILVFTETSAQDQVRKFIHYDLNKEDHTLLTREGSELAGLLIEGVISGELPLYRMSSYAKIEIFEPEIHRGSIVLRYVANEEDVLLWSNAEPYYYGDIVYQEGIMYEAIGHEFEGKPVEDEKYWTIAEASLLNPADLTQMVLDLTEQNGQTNNFIHFWYEDAWYGENYYLFSFRAGDCEKYLSSKKIPVYKEADPLMGLVTGSVFVSDAINNTNRKLANLAISLPSYVQASDPYDDQLAVNLDKGMVFNTGDGMQLLGNFQVDQLLANLGENHPFDGFYDMGQFLHFLTPESEEEISIKGAFVNDNDQVFFDETVVTDAKDPYSMLETIDAKGAPARLQGPFSMIEVVAYDLEYPDNPVLNAQDKQLSKVLIEAAKAKKIKNFYKDGFLTEKITQESWVAELAVRDWEMEEEYRDLPYWDSNESYEANDKIIVSDTVYISEADFNRGNDPENFQGGFWKIDKIISNTETYKFDEFNLLYVAYEKSFDNEGKILSRQLKAVQPVVGSRYTVEENPVTPGFIPIEDAAPFLSKYSTNVEGQTLTYDKVIAGDYLIGAPVLSGHIRLQ